MNLKSAQIPLFLLALIFPIVGRGQEAPGDLLPNGGFESGNLTPWSNQGTSAHLTDTPANVHSGQFALETKTGGGITMDIPSLETGKSYTLSYFAKAEKDNSARVNIEMAGSPLAGGQLISGEIYQRHEISFTVPKAGPVKLWFWKDAGMGNGSAYADDFSLTEMKTQDFGTLFPGNAPLFNVKAFGAVGDGIHDDTSAIQTAIAETQENDIFFPAGKYLISSTLEWKSAAGKWRCGVHLLGENQKTTTILLKDDTFTRPDSPQPMLKTASQEDWGDGRGNEAFENFIENLTIDTGKHNPGAIGIDYIGNNRAAIRNTTIQSGSDDSSGVTGISMLRDYVGPCFFKNVTIRGFNYGMDVSRQDYSITMEHIALSGQKIAGIRNQNNILNIHDFKSDNSIPALESTGALGLVTIIDASLNNGDPANAGIINQGHLYLRDIKASGYKSALDGTPGDQISFYCSSKPIIFGPITSPLSLPIKETPEAYVEPAALWADPGLANGADDTAAIQAAMDSGKHTVYFRSPIYKITDTITVPGSVRRIVGLNSRIYPVGPKFADRNAPRVAIRFSGTTDDLVVERLNFGVWNFDAPGAIYIENASSKALALVDGAIEGGMHHSYQNTAQSGPLFIEDENLDGENAGIRAATGWQFNHEDVWARQFNDEIFNQRVLNDGGNLWILGVKTERGGTIIGTTDGGKTELLGGLLYPLAPAGAPAFVSKDSSLSLTYATSAYQVTANDYDVDIDITDGTQKDSITRADLDKIGLATSTRTVVPLFICSPGKMPLQTTAAP
jgi:hypothetical protein